MLGDGHGPRCVESGATSEVFASRMNLEKSLTIMSTQEIISA